MKKFAYKTLCLLDLYEKTDQKMKKLFPFILILYSGCSDKPVDMDVVLFERSGQYITNENYSDFFFFNRKVYNGPGYNKYRSGEKREQGTLKNGFKVGIWTGWDRQGNKRFDGEYVKGKAQGKWVGYHIGGEKKYEGLYELGFQKGKWLYFNENGKKILEETYYNCDAKCEDEHPPDRRGVPYVCEKLGKLVDTKNF